MTTAGRATEPVFGPEDDRIEAALDVAAHNARSPYNVPGFSPVRDELRGVPLEVVRGRIPADLEGVYLRNGTNVQFETTHVRLHTFNGAAMLHQVQFVAGVATYSNTYVRTPRFDIEQSAGREVYVSFSDLAGGGTAALEKIRLVESKKQRGIIPNLSPLESTTASTSVQVHAGEIYCLQETGYPFVLDAAFDGDRLVLDGTGRLERWGGALKSAFSAHVRIDPDRGDMYNLGIDRSTGDVHFGVLEDGSLAHAARVHEQPAGPHGRMAYLHDYFLTEHYLVFPDCSLRGDLARLRDGSMFFFDTTYNLRWGVLPRRPVEGDRVRWFETAEPGFIWHVANAWETSRDGVDRIVMYAPMFESYPADIPIHTPAEPHAKFRRWVLDLGSGAVTTEVLIDHGYERPSLNLRYVGKPNRYVYLLDEERAGYMGKGVLKYDLESERDAGYFDYGDYFGGEALFVPRANARSEDDGYLLELLMADAEAALLVIDAATMEEVARLRLPRRVPFGVHSCWIDERRLDEMKWERAARCERRPDGTNA